MAREKENRGMSRKRVERLRRRLEKMIGERLRGDRFELRGSHGVRLRVCYLEQERLLRLEILDKNWYVSNRDVWKYVHKHLGVA